jgi:hypothetical protein
MSKDPEPYPFPEVSIIATFSRREKSENLLLADKLY